MTMMEKADKFFEARGFWSDVLPHMLASNAVVIGIVISPLVRGLDNRKVLIAMGILLLIFSAQFIRYRLAARKHRQLKVCYGAGYARLLEERKISISALTVLLMGSPGRQAERLLPDADKLNGKDPRLGW